MRRRQLYIGWIIISWMIGRELVDRGVAFAQELSRPSVALHFNFPNDVSVLDCKRDFGAAGDGIADDTEALQAAIDASCGLGEKSRGRTNLLWIPNGTYRVTKSLVVRSAIGPWISGESRDGVTIRLDDGVQGVTAVLRTHPNEQGPTSADWFMRNLRHFTIDVGDNPETDGIRYYATNSGTLADVRIVGNGKIGINSGFLDQNGPNLVRDVEIDGFETGILSQWMWSQTYSNIVIRRCRKVGVAVDANVVSIENLRTFDVPLVLENRFPNDWYHWSGVVALVGGNFENGNQQGPAIKNTGVLYARNLTANGYAKAIESSTEGGNPSDQAIAEYSSHRLRKVHDDAPTSSLQLPIKQPPTVPWENDSAKWLCIDEYRANGSDGADDSDAIEKAIQTAAKEGKTTVYFRGCGGPEPNWFNVSRPIVVPAPIRRIMGLGWARLLADRPSAGFVVDNSSSQFVHFQNIDAFGGPPASIVNRSSDRTIIVESCGVHIEGQGLGDIFVLDCPSLLSLKNPGQKCWARQLNPEGTSDTGLVENNGGTLWCLGVKHEGRGIRFATRNRGQTEILGLFNYGGNPEEMDMRPSFVVDRSRFSLAAIREIAFDSHTYYNKVQENEDDETRVLDKSNEGGWIGWSLYRSRR